jgi:hypothetical protein
VKSKQKSTASGHPKGLETDLVVVSDFMRSTLIPIPGKSVGYRCQFLLRMSLFRLRTFSSGNDIYHDERSLGRQTN